MDAYASGYIGIGFFLTSILIKYVQIMESYSYGAPPENV